jgi:methionine-rich copper-binding protein CopC
MKVSAIAVVVVGLAVSSSAYSHAMLNRANPAVGSEVKSSPPRLELWFSEELEPAFSTVEVVDRSGKQVDRGDKTFDSHDRSHVAVSLPTLPAGRYRVIWRALSVDTHSTAGEFTFDIAP